jgi:hypothetical protein
MHEYGAALTDLNQALNKQGTVEGYFARGKIYEQQSDVSHATSDFRRATELKPKAVFDLVAQVEAKSEFSRCRNVCPAGVPAGPRTTARACERQEPERRPANPCRLMPTGISRKDDRRRVVKPGGPSRTCAGNSSPARKSMQDHIVGSKNIPGNYSGRLFCFTLVGERRARRWSGLASQGLPFDASLAAVMTPLLICRICSPALVN